MANFFTSNSGSFRPDVLKGHLAGEIYSHSSTEIITVNYEEFYSPSYKVKYIGDFSINASGQVVGTITSVVAYFKNTSNPYFEITDLNQDAHEYFALALSGQGVGALQTLLGGADLIDASEHQSFYGQQYIYGYQGNDLIYASYRDDQVFGGQGADTLVGAAGADSLSGGAGRDHLKGNSGNDSLLGGAGADKLAGNQGNDFLNGGSGADTLLAGDGHDTLKGGVGHDRLFGGAGRDTLNGNQGVDQLYGGAGHDTFVFSKGKTTVMDFNATLAHEVINLQAARGITGFADLMANHISQIHSDVLIEDTAGNTLFIKDVEISELSTADFVF